MRTLTMAAVLVILAGALAQPGAAAVTWSRDQNQNQIDDHIEAVQTGGLAAAYENGDPTQRLRIDVTEAGGLLTYGVYVKYDQLPTAAYETALRALGLPTHRYSYIPYIRSRATFAQMQAILAQPGVSRVEALPLMYASNDNATRAMRVADSDYVLFPSTGDLGYTGRGVVIAIIDSGVNDAPDATTGYPGHESLIGKWVGGGNFSNPDASLNTPLNGSENVVDRSPDFSHGSHVAGSALGTGGPSGIVTDGGYGYYRGIAPDARLVDCKALSDAGVGGGAPDALEWCIFHKNDDWGLTGDDAVYRGIQVVNMSLGGLLEDSDGTDANSAAANAAVRAGLVLCVSTGNDGNTGYISSPSAADLVISVGASVDVNTVGREDDVVAGFSNEGPRRADPDTDQMDEMKPSIVPPGGGVTSVEGVLTASGDGYVTTNGTSMSSPIAAGMCALIIQACPSLTPDEVKRIIQDTADHRTTGGKQPPGAVDPFGLDPNYHPSWGWGNPDGYAAVLEAAFPTRTQVVKMSAKAVAGGIDFSWLTQREIDVTGFDVLRASPLYGARGPFVRINASTLTPIGDPNIHATSNRTSYLYEDRDPALTAGETYWYRVEWRDGAGRVHQEPAFRIQYEPPTALATVQWSITHDYMDNDLLVIIGAGTDASDPTRTAEFFFPAPGSADADSSVPVPGDPTIGTQRRYFSRVLTDQDFGATQVLPPSAANPWFFYAAEGGFLDTHGRIEDFRITVHGLAGNVTYTPLAPVFPLPTVEHVPHTVWIPADPAASVNHTPVLDPVGNREALEGRTLQFTLTAHDADGQALTYSAPTLPPGATFNAGTRTFTWSPGYGAVSTTTTYSATFRVQDAALIPANDTETIEIRLHDVDPAGNLPPYWDPIIDRSVLAGNTVSFTVSAVDPESDALTYAAVDLPPGSSFDSGTRRFTWDTDTMTDGEFSVAFDVNDAGHPAVREEVQITVKENQGFTAPCATSALSFDGESSIGSSDLGNADQDTVWYPVDGHAARLYAQLTWTGNPAVDLDYFLYDPNGTAIESGASTNHPEGILVDDLDPGLYYFVVVGFTVPAPTTWSINVEECATLDVPATLTHFEASPEPGQVRLQWAIPAGDEVAGFHVYRSRQPDSGYERVNAALIQGQGVYQFEDTKVPADMETAYYRLGLVTREGAEQRYGPYSVDVRTVRPRFSLAQNFPNPFGASRGTEIHFNMAEAAEARLLVFDLRGALVRTLIDGRLDSGAQRVVWDGTDFRGRDAASGVYFYRLEVPGRHVETRRMILTN